MDKKTNMIAEVKHLVDGLEENSSTRIENDALNVTCLDLQEMVIGKNI